MRVSAFVCLFAAAQLMVADASVDRKEFNTVTEQSSGTTSNSNEASQTKESSETSEIKKTVIGDITTHEEIDRTMKSKTDNKMVVKKQLSREPVIVEEMEKIKQAGSMLTKKQEFSIEKATHKSTSLQNGENFENESFTEENEKEVDLNAIKNETSNNEEISHIDSRKLEENEVKSSKNNLKELSFDKKDVIMQKQSEINISSNKIQKEKESSTNEEEERHVKEYIIHQHKGQKVFTDKKSYKEVKKDKEQFKIQNKLQKPERFIQDRKTEKQSNELDKFYKNIKPQNQQRPKDQLHSKAEKQENQDQKLEELSSQKLEGGVSNDHSQKPDKVDKIKKSKNVEHQKKLTKDKSSKIPYQSQSPRQPNRSEYGQEDRKGQLQGAFQTDLNLKTLIIPDGGGPGRCFCSCDTNSKPVFFSVDSKNLPSRA